MRDFNGRRTFTALILVDPIQAEFKNESGNRNTQRKLKPSHIGRQTGSQVLSPTRLLC